MAGTLVNIKLSSSSKLMSVLSDGHDCHDLLWLQNISQSRYHLGIKCLNLNLKLKKRKQNANRYIYACRVNSIGYAFTNESWVHGNIFSLKCEIWLLSTVRFNQKKSRKIIRKERIQAFDSHCLPHGWIQNCKSYVFGNIGNWYIEISWYFQYYMVKNIPITSFDFLKYFQNEI